MSTYPPLEARVSALEHQQTILNARIEEATGNMTNSIKHLSDDMTAVKADIKHLSNDMTAVKVDINHLSNDMAAVKADIKHLSDNMAVVKSDVRRLSNDMTASFNQAVQYDMRVESQIDARFNKIEATMATKEDLEAVKNDI